MHQMVSKENEIYRSIKSIHDFYEEDHDDNDKHEYSLHEFNWLTAFEINIKDEDFINENFDIIGNDLIDLPSIDYNKLRNYIHIRTNVKIIKNGIKSYQ